MAAISARLPQHLGMLPCFQLSGWSKENCQKLIRCFKLGNSLFLQVRLLHELTPAQVWGRALMVAHKGVVPLTRWQAKQSDDLEMVRQVGLRNQGLGRLFMT